MAVSPTVVVDRVVFLVRKSRVKPLSDGIFFCGCQWAVWSALLGSLLITYGFLRKVKNRRGFSVKLLRFLHAFSLLTLGLTLSTFANFLAIYLSRTAKYTKPFDNLLELSQLLLSEERRFVALLEDSKTSVYINPANDLNLSNHVFPNQKIIDNFKSAYDTNRPLFVTTVEEIIEEVLKDENLIGIVYRSVIDIVQSRYCDLDIVNIADSVEQQFVIIYSKNANVNVINKLNGYLMQGEVGNLWRLEYQRRIQLAVKASHFCEKKIFHIGDPLKLSQLHEIYYVLLVGSLLGLAGAVLEKMWAKSTKRDYQQKKRGTEKYQEVTFAMIPVSLKVDKKRSLSI